MKSINNGNLDELNYIRHFLTQEDKYPSHLLRSFPQPDNKPSSLKHHQHECQ